MPARSGGRFALRRAGGWRGGGSRAGRAPRRSGTSIGHLSTTVPSRTESTTSAGPGKPGDGTAGGAGGLRRGGFLLGGVSVGGG